MPFFDYICGACANELELLISRKDVDAEVLCPRCKFPMHRRMCNPEFKIDGAPPKNWQPLAKNQPKSEVRNIHEIRRVEDPNK